MNIVFLILVTSLSGCGMATYTYKHTKFDGSSCSVEVTSLRELKGAGLNIDKDCQLNGKADSMTANYDFIKALAAIIGGLK